MRHYVLALWVLFALCSLAAPSRAEAPRDDGWKRLDEEDGIVLWKRELPGQLVPGFRGQVDIAAGFAPIIAAIEDTTRHTEWMHRCAEAKTLRRIGEHTSIVYNRTDSPWPVADRDAVLRSEREESADGSQVLMRFQQVTDAAMPPVKGVVRMPKLIGYYKLTRLGPSSTRVVYQVDADVGGSLPKWIVKIVVRDIPFETLSRLRKRVTR